MKLNLAILADKLSDLNPRICLKTDRSLLLADVRLLKNPAQLSPEYLYLCTRETLNGVSIQPGMSIAVAGGSIETCAYLEQANLDGLVFDINLDIFEIFERIQDIFSRFNNLFDQLTGAILREEPLDNLLDICANFFDNPVLLTDASLSLVALSRHYAYPETDRAWQDIISTGISSASMINELKRRGLTALLNSAPQPVLIDIGPKYPPYICANFFDQGTRIASLSIIQFHTPVSPLQLGLVDFIASLLARVILKHHSSVTHRRTLLIECIDKMLQGRQIDGHLVVANLSNFGWDLHDHYLLLRIEFPQQAVQNGTVEHSKNVYTRLFADCITLNIANTFVLIVHGNIPSEANQMEMLALREQLAADGARCGISLPFCDFTVLRDQYQLAGAALDFGPSDRCLHRYSDHMNEHLLSELAKILPLKSFCHSDVVKLHEYDRQTKGDLIHSLLVYIKYERSLKIAAQELHIHRNSLVYRISRIQTYTQLALDDPQTRLHILLSCQILRYLDNLDIN